MRQERMQRPPGEFMVEENVELGPDERLYATGSSEGIWARDPAAREWLSVQPPDGVPDPWHPRFVAGADGRLYAIHFHGSWAFTPDR